MFAGFCLTQLYLGVTHGVRGCVQSMFRCVLSRGGDGDDDDDDDRQ